MKISECIPTDILIIGGGLSGLTAAWATGSKKKVMVLLDGAGASPYVHGFSLPAGEGDSPELLFRDTRESGRFQGKESLEKHLAFESLEVPPLLRELDISLDRNPDGSLALLRPLGASVPRVASAGNHTGAVVLAKLRKRLIARGNTSLLTGFRALRLLHGPAGVAGALVFDRQQNRFLHFAADTVILACGGFCGIYPFSTNTSDIGGDGIAMASMAGAALCDLEFIQFEPCVALSPNKIRGKGLITTMFFEGACLRNHRYERFLAENPEGERLNKDVLCRKIVREIKRGGGTPNGGVWFDATSVGRERLVKTYPAYVERYAACGIDLAAQPVEVAPAPHTSLGGVEIDKNCTTSLPGLLACGEIAGGVHGANRIGGNAGLETFVFGMTAGYAASSAEPRISEFMPEEESLPLVPCELRHRMRNMMMRELEQNLGIFRCRKGLRHALQTLQELMMNFSAADNGTPKEYYETLRLQNDLYTAVLLTQAALERKDSCGCHIRTDHSDREESE